MTKTSMYHVLNTKIAAIHGRMLQNEDYRRMLSMNSIAEIVGYLKNHTDYRHLLQNAKTDSIERFELEKILNEKLVDMIEKFKKYTTGSYRSFLNCFHIRYEIDELKQIATHIQQGDGFPHHGKLVFLSKNQFSYDPNGP